MKKGNLTRNEAIAAAGLQAVIAVDLAEARPTDRVGYTGARWDADCASIVHEGDESWEWAACVRFIDDEGYPAYLTAYYYIPGDTRDIGAADWTVAGYAID